MQNNRGSINNRGRAKQLIDFSGLRFGNITPTDSDWPPMQGGIEYGNKLYVFAEFKLGTAKMPYGQRLFHERHTDDLERSGKPTLCIIASHNKYDPNEDIDAANTSVTEYRLKGEWITFSPESIITTKEIIELFLANLEIGSKEFQYLCTKNHRTQNNLSKFMEIK